MYYSPKLKRVYLPKDVFKRVNAFINLAHFYTQPDGYYVTFTKPTFELLQNSADHNIQELIVGRTTLFVKFKKAYFPDETNQITWHLVDAKTSTYKLRLWNKAKQQLNFIMEEPPPWLR